MRQIFFAAGEVSGDYQAACIAERIRSEQLPVDMIGIGGERLKAAGVHIILDITYYSSIGLVESVISGLKIRPELKKIKQFFKTHPIDLIVLIDNQGVNIPLARMAKNFKIPVLYYFPPHISVWGAWNSRKIARLADLILTPFYDDYLLYKQAGANVLYVGHPLLELVKTNSYKAQIAESMSIQAKKVVGLFPGSRVQEIKKLLPVLLKTADLIHDHYSVTFLLPVSSKRFLTDLQPYLRQYPQLDVRLVKQGDYDVYQLCDTVISASGTATLELALLKIPMIVIYKLNSLTYFLAKILIKNKMISLPNILLNEHCVPELLQNQVHHETLFRKTNAILDDANYQREMRRKLAKLPSVLGNGNTISYVSSLILKQLKLCQT